MTCQFSHPRRTSNECLLGYHGGWPSDGVCRACMAAGENNEAKAAEWRERWERAHPGDRPHISGCCDRADQS